MQGQLTDDQESVLSGEVRDQVVYDLGAGSCRLSYRLLELGASKVIAVDRNPDPDPKNHPDQVEYRRAYFHELDPITEGLAFVSWPQQYLQGLVKLVKKAPKLVYLGCNTDYTACAPTEFWEHVTRRELLYHVPHHRNTLLVYGKRTSEQRELVLEEKAGLDRSKVYSYGCDR